MTAQCAEGTNDWFYKANVSAGRPLRPVPANSDRNAGIGSQTTTQMLARFDADVVDVGTDWLVLFAGINDIGATSDPATATIQSNLESMYDQALAAGYEVIACTVYPTDFMTTAAQKASRAAVNTWIVNYVAANPGMYLCDWAPAMESSADVLNATYSDDGVHPNAAGATAMAGVLDDVLVANVVPV